MLLFWLLLTCSAPTAVLGQRHESSDCAAFSTDGLAASQFQYYRFYDFRNISEIGTQRRKRRRQDADPAANRRVTDHTWVEDWEVRDYPRASPGGQSIAVNFVPWRVETVNASGESPHYATFLRLSTARLSALDQEAGELIFSEFNVTAASMRVFGRMHGAPGAVAGIFTYQNDTQESDIELFTRAPDTFVQYSNQPSSSGEPDWIPIAGATVNNTIPGGRKSGDWLVHRLDWTAGRSVFFVNNEQTNTTDLHVPVADPPSRLYLDMWSANSSWSGSMAVGQNASFDLQWVELVFNTTEEEAPERAGGVVCAVGDVDAEAVKESAAAEMFSRRGLLLVVAVVTVAMFSI